MSADERTMKLVLPMRVWRWVFVAIYLVCLLLFADFLGVFRFVLGRQLGGSGATRVLLFTGFVLLQAVFIFGGGTVELSRPIRGWRLLIPVGVAATMMAILAGGLSLALVELLEVWDWFDPVLLGVVGFSWVFWGALLFVYCRGAERFVALRRLTATVFTGSLAVLLVSIPAHIIVSRRPGCFVGIGTAAGVAAGAAVMVWSLGPGIILLFLHEKRRFELRENRRAGTGTAQPPAG